MRCQWCVMWLVCSAAVLAVAQPNLAGRWSTSIDSSRGLWLDLSGKNNHARIVGQGLPTLNNSALQFLGSQTMYFPQDILTEEFAFVARARYRGPVSSNTSAIFATMDLVQYGWVDGGFATVNFTVGGCASSTRLAAAEFHTLAIRVRPAPTSGTATHKLDVFYDGSWRFSCWRNPTGLDLSHSLVVNPIEYDGQNYDISDFILFQSGSDISDGMLVCLQNEFAASPGSGALYPHCYSQLNRFSSFPNGCHWKKSSALRKDMSSWSYQQELSDSTRIFQNGNNYLTWLYNSNQTVRERGEYSGWLQGSDDDFVAFAVGWKHQFRSGPVDFLYIHWKGQNQAGAQRGLAISRINGSSLLESCEPLSCDPYWLAVGPSNPQLPLHSTELRRARTLGSSSFQGSSVRSWRLSVTPERLVLVVLGQVQFNVTPAELAGSGYEFPLDGHFAIGTHYMSSTQWWLDSVDASAGCVWQYGKPYGLSTNNRWTRQGDAISVTGNLHKTTQPHVAFVFDSSTLVGAGGIAQARYTGRLGGKVLSYTTSAVVWLVGWKPSCEDASTPECMYLTFTWDWTGLYATIVDKQYTSTTQQMVARSPTLGSTALQKLTGQLTFTLEISPTYVSLSLPGCNNVLNYSNGVIPTGHFGVSSSAALSTTASFYSDDDVSRVSGWKKFCSSVDIDLPIPKAVLALYVYGVAAAFVMACIFLTVAKWHKDRAVAALGE